MSVAHADDEKSNGQHTALGGTMSTGRDTPQDARTPCEAASTVMSTANKFYECGICGCVHRWDFIGDCRDDTERVLDVPDDAEVVSMDERVAADSAERQGVRTKRRVTGALNQGGRIG